MGLINMERAISQISKALMPLDASEREAVLSCVQAAHWDDSDSPSAHDSEAGDTNTKPEKKRKKKKTKRRPKASGEEMGSRRAAVEKCLLAYTAKRAGDIASSVSMTRADVSRILAKLVEAGRAERCGRGLYRRRQEGPPM